MSDTTENKVISEEKKIKYQNTVWYKTVRLTINLLIHLLLFFIVCVCLLYSFKLVRLDWHIILCVLGYQFFMCQGIMVMSQNNSWSIFVKRQHRKHIHWVLLVIAATLVTAGTGLIVHQKSTHFNTIHGKLGLAALICCLVSLLNGILAMYPKLCCCFGVFWIRFFHYITGIASMFLATGSLCGAFEYRFFGTWTGNGEVIVPLLIFFSWFFTVLVSLDFWIIVGNKIRSLF